MSNTILTSPCNIQPEFDFGLSDKGETLKNTCAETAWITLAECQKEPDKHFAKRIYCGKEWCPVCGQKRSRAHNRKIARVLPKAQQIESMGYFVIEFPDKYRKQVDIAYSKKGLQGTTNKIVEVFAGKRMGRKGRINPLFKRGLIRWHWMGDKSNGKWNPHLNILVDGEYIGDLEPIKTKLREALDCPDLIVHYSYADEPGRKFQRVEYITRATFKNYDWNPYMAHQLYGFRNQRWWGKWNGPAVWHIDAEQEAALLAADALECGHCPDCGGDLVWTKPIHAGYLEAWQAEEIGETGFYRLPVQDFTGHDLTPDEIMRLSRLEREYTANIVMRIKDRSIAFNEVLEYIDSLEIIDDIPGEFIGRDIQGEIDGLLI